MSLYSNYVECIKSIRDLKNSGFKSDPRYVFVLEHVYPEYGYQYLQNAMKEFPEITLNQIREFVELNDLFGHPKKYYYDHLNTTCSPTSLRYVYHALTILRLYKQRNTRRIVEIGCGYGGLFLAIQFFSKVMGITIEHYHLIDLPEVGGFIRQYLELHSSFLQIPYSIHNSNDYGADISSLQDDLFLISNYCLTEIDKIHRQKYLDVLFPKINSGFVIWQSYIGKNIQETLHPFQISVEEEKPQTSPEYPNYHVHFFNKKF